MTGSKETLVHRRELLANFVRKELKVKYRNSVLGFVWSTLNPLMYLVIFSVVLVGFLRVALPWYHFYLLSGLLVWNLFSVALTTATGSIVGNANLVTKTYFPRQLLPLSAIGAAFVHFALQLAVLVGAMVLFSYHRFWDAGLALLPIAIAVQTVLLVGLSLALTCMNVYYRDIGHLLELGLLAWFWLTPIVYPSSLGQGRFWQLYLLNPMTPIVLATQRALYSQVAPEQAGEPTLVLVDAPITWYLERLGYVAVLAVVVLAAGLWIFRRLDRRLAEEL